jgi:hypothetical protein
LFLLSKLVNSTIPTRPLILPKPLKDQLATRDAGSQ